VTFAAEGIAEYRTEAQRRELLPKVAAGRLRLRWASPNRTPAPISPA
jgi:hypothetical protein